MATTFEKLCGALASASHGLKLGAQAGSKAGSAFGPTGQLIGGTIGAVTLAAGAAAHGYHDPDTALRHFAAHFGRH